MLKHSKLLFLLSVGAVIAITQGCGSTPPLSESCQDLTSTPFLPDFHKAPLCINPTPPTSENSIAYGVRGDPTLFMTVGERSSSAGDRGEVWIKLGGLTLKSRYRPAAPYTWSEVHDLTYTPLSFLLAGVIGRQEGMSTITQAAYVSNPIRTGNRTLQPLPGASRSEASGVNYDGTVIVGWGAPSTTGVHAVLWRKNSSGTFIIEDLGVLHDGLSSKAHDVSGNGNIVVGERTTTGGSIHAFCWVRGRTPEPMQDLPTLGGRYSHAFGVSRDGNVIVGDSTNEHGKFRAVLWRKNSSGTFVIEDLGVLHEDDNAFSSARKADSDGNVVVGMSTVEGGMMHAFRWVRGRTPEPMQDLGTLPNHTLSKAFDVTPDGNVVVGLSAIYDRVERKFEKHAFYWMDSEGMKDLNEDR